MEMHAIDKENAEDDGDCLVGDLGSKGGDGVSNSLSPKHTRSCPPEWKGYSGELEYIGDGIQNLGAMHSLARLQVGPKDQANTMALLADRKWSSGDYEPRMRRRNLKFNGIIGSGSFGRLWNATLKDDQRVAVRQYYDPRCKKAQMMKMIMKERDVLIYLKNQVEKNVVNIVGAFFENDPFIVMELCVGDLRDVCGRGTPHRYLTYFVQILEGLKYIHDKGIWHLDLRPANVLITTANHAVMTDFGKAIVNMDKTVTAMRTATPLSCMWYSDWEANSHNWYGAKTDVWAAGCILFEMDTGKNLMHVEGLSDPSEYAVIAQFGHKCESEGQPLKRRPLLDHCVLNRCRFTTMLQHMLTPLWENRLEAANLLQLHELKELCKQYSISDNDKKIEETGHLVEAKVPKTVLNFDFCAEIGGHDVYQKAMTSMYYDELEHYSFGTGPPFVMYRPIASVGITDFARYIVQNGYLERFIQAVAENDPVAMGSFCYIAEKSRGLSPAGNSLVSITSSSSAHAKDIQSIVPNPLHTNPVSSTGNLVTESVKSNEQKDIDFNDITVGEESCTGLHIPGCSSAPICGDKPNVEGSVTRVDDGILRDTDTQRESCGSQDDFGDTQLFKNIVEQMDDSNNGLDTEPNSEATNHNKGESNKEGSCDANALQSDEESLPSITASPSKCDKDSIPISAKPTEKQSDVNLALDNQDNSTKLDENNTGNDDQQLLKQVIKMSCMEIFRESKVTGKKQKSKELQDTDADESVQVIDILGSSEDEAIMKVIQQQDSRPNRGQKPLQTIFDTYNDDNTIGQKSNKKKTKIQITSENPKAITCTSLKQNNKPVDKTTSSKQKKLKSADETEICKEICKQPLKKGCGRIKENKTLNSNGAKPAKMAKGSCPKSQMITKRAFPITKTSKAPRKGAGSGRKGVARNSVKTKPITATTTTTEFINNSSSVTDSIDKKSVGRPRKMAIDVNPPVVNVDFDEECEILIPNSKRERKPRDNAEEKQFDNDKQNRRTKKTIRYFTDSDEETVGEEAEKSSPPAKRAKVTTMTEQRKNGGKRVIDPNDDFACPAGKCNYFGTRKNVEKHLKSCRYAAEQAAECDSTSDDGSDCSSSSSVISNDDEN